jgi:hypothetical protein
VITERTEGKARSGEGEAAKVNFVKHWCEFIIAQYSFHHSSLFL